MKVSTLTVLILFLINGAFIGCKGTLITGDAEDEEDAVEEIEDGQDIDVVHEPDVETDIPVACTTGEVRCGIDGIREVCTADGEWQDSPCPAGQVCTGAGVCTDTVCSPGETRCDPEDPTRVEICNETQTGWVFSETCADGSVCEFGVCVPATCEPGSTLCTSDGRVRTCNEAGTGYGPPEDCDEGFVCDGTGCVEIICTPGEAECIDGATRRICNYLGSGYDIETCGEGTACDGGVCLEQICVPGETRCDPANPLNWQQCNETGTSWGSPMPCPLDEICEDGVCVPVACSPGETVCIDDNTLGICNPMGTGYDEMPCPDGFVCYDGACTEVVCTPGERRCSGERTVEECNDSGTGYETVELCDETMDERCVDGQCLTLCQQAARAYSSMGCIFYGVDLDQADQMDADNSDYAIVVINPHSTLSAAVTIEDRRGSGSTWRSRATRTILPHDLYTFRLTPDQHLEDTDQLSGYAYRVSSNIPISAFQFNPIDSANEYTNDASLLLPKSTLGTRYWIAAGPKFPGLGFHSFATVVGAQDGTSVSITASVDTQAGGPIPALSAGATHTTTIDEGEVLQLANADDGGDMSGTYITSSIPVAVFGGSECSDVPYDCTFCQDHGGTAVTECHYCDHLEEQMIPLQAWGRTYVAGRVPVRSSGGVEGSYWKIIASEDSTSVGVSYAPGTVLRTDAGSPPFTLNTGDVLHLELAGTAAAPGDAFVTADKPVLVVQYIEGTDCTDRALDEGGDPAMILAVPTEQYLDDYAFITPTGYNEDYAVIIKQTASTVMLDGTALSGTSFPVASGWEVYRPTAADGVHAASGTAAFGIICVGFSPYNSYGYMGGLSLRPINPP